MKVNAIWVTDIGKIECRPMKIPDNPEDNEVQIRVKACGVCAYDAALFRGITAEQPMPYTLGHEAVGIIEKVGKNVAGWKVGDRVFSGQGGGFAEYVNLEACCIARIPAYIEDFAQAVLEPACCITSMIQQADLKPGAHVALVGAGYMGLLAVQALMRATAIGLLTVFEIDPDRRQLALQYGAAECCNPLDTDGKSKIDQIIADGGADVVIDFSGSESGFGLSDKLISSAGTLILGAWHRHDLTFSGTRWHLAGVQVKNLAPQSNKYFREIIPATSLLAERGVYDQTALITHVADISDMEAVQHLFERAVDKKDHYLKGVVTFM